MKRQYRVRWQREGYDRRQKVVATREQADRFAARLQGDIGRVEDPDGYACCSGWECGCRGITNAEAAEQERERYAKLPPLTFGPVIDSREVGEWVT